MISVRNSYKTIFQSFWWSVWDLIYGVKAQRTKEINSLIQNGYLRKAKSGQIGITSKFVNEMLEKNGD